MPNHFCAMGPWTCVTLAINLIQNVNLISNMAAPSKNYSEIDFMKENAILT